MRILYRACAIFSSAKVSAVALPEILTRLMREVCPLMISTSRGGTASALARTRPNAALASPSLGIARTRTFNTLLPSERVSMPSMASRPPFGVRRTVTTTPLGAAVQAADIRSEDVGQDVERDAVANEDDDQDENDRRDVDAAHRRQHVADRPEHRLGDAVEKFADRCHDRVARIDHVEGDQPRQDGRCDQQPNVELQGK